MQVFFSIITVCLNAGEQLQKTVLRVLEQDFPDFEIIIKDGVSVDDSLEMLPSDKRIKIIVNSDEGIYDAMNQSLSYVTGKYLIFLNAGDLLESSTVLSSVRRFINENQGLGLYYYDYKTTSFDKKVNSPRTLNGFTLFRNMLCHQCCVFEVDKFEATGKFHLEYQVVADYDFLLRFLVLQTNNYKSIDLLGVIFQSGGYSSQNRSLALKEVQSVRRRYFGSKYILYSILLRLTFPKFRMRIVQSNNKLIRSWYLNIINTINRRL